MHIFDLRTAFPYSFAARGIICANYALCTNCTHHLLAWQYTATGGMHQSKLSKDTPRGVSVSFCLCSAQKATAFPVHFCVAYLGSIHSPRSARNMGHRFMKNNNQLFFSRSHTCLPFGSNITSTHTCSASLLLHLLAWQYTATGGMHQSNATNV